MMILAKAVKGAEFMYNPRSAHSVSKARAESIRDALNGINYGLNDGEIWHIYEIDEYSQAYAYGTEQKFFINRGSLKEKKMYSWR